MVVNGNLDSKKNRLTRREKKASLADALADDVLFKERADKYIGGEKAKRERRKQKRSEACPCLFIHFCIVFEDCSSCRIRFSSVI